MRVMGLDIGEKIIGIALSDPNGLIASSYRNIERQELEKDLEEIKKIALECGVQKIVIGFPKNMNGTIGPQARRIMEFKEALEKAVDLPVILWDERLSTVAVEKILIEGNMSRKKRKKVIDKMAASYILQGYLDKIRSENLNNKNVDR